MFNEREMGREDAEKLQKPGRREKKWREDVERT